MDQENLERQFGERLRGCIRENQRIIKKLDLEICVRERLRAICCMTEAAKKRLAGCEREAVCTWMEAWLCTGLLHHCRLMPHFGTEVRECRLIRCDSG